MLKELVYFARHAPATLALKRRMSQTELYETVMNRADDAGMYLFRSDLVADLSGRVLEVGCGTGMMFRHYSGDAEIEAIEPDRAFLESARARVRDADAAIAVSEADGTALPFADESFDAVVFSMVLCSVTAVDRVLAKARRVLRPGGQLRLIEHVRSSRPVSATLMHAFNPLWRLANGQGCNMNRDPIPFLERAGFALEPVRPFKIFTPGLPPFPMLSIRATR